jgi:Uroporphyrinogen decarboxylase (URO-D)
MSSVIHPGGSNDRGAPNNRIATAMNLGIPDRVPLMCQCSIGHMLLQLDCSPAEFWNDLTVFAEGLLAIRDMYDFDGVLVSLHGHDPDWRSGVAAIRSHPEGEEIVWRNGDRTIFPRNDLPRHLPAAPRPGLRLGHPGAVLPRIDYIPVSQGLHFCIADAHRFDIFPLLQQYVGNRFSLHGEVTSPFDYYLDLVGVEEGLMGFLEHPDAARAILLHCAGGVAEIARSMSAAGVDAIKISSPYAGSGFISRAQYNEFVLPYERIVATAIEECGVKAYTHTCGAIGDRMDLLLASGVSGIECLDPPPLGNVDLRDALDRTRGKGFIKGNIDPVNQLWHGSRESIAADAMDRIMMGKARGGFILSTACSIAPATPRDHVLVLREAVERWG